MYKDYEEDKKIETKKKLKNEKLIDKEKLSTEAYYLLKIYNDLHWLKTFIFTSIIGVIVLAIIYIFLIPYNN